MHGEVRPIPGFPGYHATEYGDILSDRKAPGRKMKASWNGRYYNVSLWRADDTPITVNLHVVVCLAFHGAKPAGFVCRHIDGDPHNNRASNLCWGTVTENNRDRVKHRTIARGENHSRSKLRDWEVAEIAAYSRAGVSVVALAKAYGMSKSGIEHIKYGRRHCLAT